MQIFQGAYDLRGTIQLIALAEPYLPDDLSSPERLSWLVSLDPFKNKPALIEGR
jgi:hypothetical protein